jgi:hypothetical protein
MKPVLYVNGDSHTAAAEAVNSCGFAQDDSRRHIKVLGRRPHPDNLAVSWGQKLADALGYSLVCGAESASSNARILRTTKEYLISHRPDLIVIGWSTWERQEWFHDGIWWQVNAGGMGHDWPDAVKSQYREYVLNIDWAQAQHQAHLEIYEFHHLLKLHGIPHIFFSTFNDFSTINTSAQANWGQCYLNPYDPKHTFYDWCLQQGFKTVYPGSYHFDPDAHEAWADHLYKSYFLNLLTR